MKKIVNQNTRFLGTLALLFLVVVLASCGKNSSQEISQFIDNNNSSGDLPGDVDQGPDDEPLEFFKPSICSKLAIENVGWPASMSDFQINAYALAMNITGSFEGHTGWKNLSNNFDGQGVSLGLFNQNLGQGSLQPLMIKLRNSHLTKMKSFFSKSQFDSINNMLTKWGGSSSVQSKALPNLYESDFSELDDPELIDFNNEENTGFFQKALSGKNGVSVNWATQNLYSGSSFKADWKKSLTVMAGTPEYVTIQVGAAKSISDKALGYMKKFNFKELRAYLFFFDIVVQNGGITSAIESKYATWAKSNPKASETTRLKKMLELRLALVKKQYVSDVRARKTAVIDGTGTVHGSKRDFKKEYCAPTWGTQFP